MPTKPGDIAPTARIAIGAFLCPPVNTRLPTYFCRQSNGKGPRNNNFRVWRGETSVWQGAQRSALIPVAITLLRNTATRDGSAFQTGELLFRGPLVRVLQVKADQTPRRNVGVQAHPTKVN